MIFQPITSLQAIAEHEASLASLTKAHDALMAAAAGHCAHKDAIRAVLRPSKGIRLPTAVLDGVVVSEVDVDAARKLQTLASRAASKKYDVMGENLRSILINLACPDGVSEAAAEVSYSARRDVSAYAEEAGYACVVLWFWPTEITDADQQQAVAVGMNWSREGISLVDGNNVAVGTAENVADSLRAIGWRLAAPSADGDDDGHDDLLDAYGHEEDVGIWRGALEVVPTEMPIADAVPTWAGEIVPTTTWPELLAKLDSAAQTHMTRTPGAVPAVNTEAPKPAPVTVSAPPAAPTDIRGVPVVHTVAEVVERAGSTEDAISVRLFDIGNILTGIRDERLAAIGRGEMTALYGNANRLCDGVRVYTLFMGNPESVYLATLLPAAAAVAETVADAHSEVVPVSTQPLPAKPRGYDWAAYQVEAEADLIASMRPCVAPAKTAPASTIISDARQLDIEDAIAEASAAPIAVLPDDQILADVVHALTPQAPAPAKTTAARKPKAAKVNTVIKSYDMPSYVITRAAEWEAMGFPAGMPFPETPYVGMSPSEILALCESGGYARRPAEGDRLTYRTRNWHYVYDVYTEANGIEYIGGSTMDPPYDINRQSRRWAGRGSRQQAGKKAIQANDCAS